MLSLTSPSGSHSGQARPLSENPLLLVSFQDFVDILDNKSQTVSGRILLPPVLLAL